MKEYEDTGRINQNNEDTCTTEERYYLARLAVFNSSNGTSHTLVELDGP